MSDQRPFTDQEVEVLAKLHCPSIHFQGQDGYDLIWVGPRGGHCVFCSMVAEIKRLRAYHRRPIWAATADGARSEAVQ